MGIVIAREFSPDGEDDERTDEADEIEATLREVRTFMDDPVALLERALMLVKRAAALVA